MLSFARSVPFPYPAFSLLHVADETHVRKRDMKNHSVFLLSGKNFFLVIPVPSIILQSSVLSFFFGVLRGPKKLQDKSRC